MTPAIFNHQSYRRAAARCGPREKLAKDQSLALNKKPFSGLSSAVVCGTACVPSCGDRLVALLRCTLMHNICGCAGCAPHEPHGRGGRTAASMPSDGPDTHGCASLGARRPYRANMGGGAQPALGGQLGGGAPAGPFLLDIAGIFELLASHHALSRSWPEGHFRASKVKNRREGAAVCAALVDREEDGLQQQRRPPRDLCRLSIPIA